MFRSSLIWCFAVCVRLHSAAAAGDITKAAVMSAIRQQTKTSYSKADKSALPSVRPNLDAPKDAIVKSGVASREITLDSFVNGYSRFDVDATFAMTGELKGKAFCVILQRMRSPWYSFKTSWRECLARPNLEAAVVIDYPFSNVERHATAMARLNTKGLVGVVYEFTDKKEVNDLLQGRTLAKPNDKITQFSSHLSNDLRVGKVTPAIVPAAAAEFEKRMNEVYNWTSSETIDNIPADLKILKDLAGDEVAVAWVGMLDKKTPFCFVRHVQFEVCSMAWADRTSSPKNAILVDAERQHIYTLVRDDTMNVVLREGAPSFAFRPSGLTMGVVEYPYYFSYKSTARDECKFSEFFNQAETLPPVLTIATKPTAAVGADSDNIVDHNNFSNTGYGNTVFGGSGGTSHALVGADSDNIVDHNNFSNTGYGNAVFGGSGGTSHALRFDGSSDKFPKGRSHRRRYTRASSNTSLYGGEESVTRSKRKVVKRTAIDLILAPLQKVETEKEEAVDFDAMLKLYARRYDRMETEKAEAVDFAAVLNRHAIRYDQSIGAEELLLLHPDAVHVFVGVQGTRQFCKVLSNLPTNASNSNCNVALREGDIENTSKALLIHNGGFVVELETSMQYAAAEGEPKYFCHVYKGQRGLGGSMVGASSLVLAVGPF